MADLSFVQFYCSNARLFAVMDSPGSGRFDPSSDCEEHPYKKVWNIRKVHHSVPDIPFPEITRFFFATNRGIPTNYIMSHPRLAATTLFLLAITLASCHTTEDTASSDHDDYHAEVRGFSDYETWKPSGQSSTPDVILIKQKEPDHHHHHGSSLSSVLKDNLPLLAVLAPLAAVAVLFPLKAFLGANYVLFPPVAAPPAMPPAARDRVGKEDTSFAETQTLAAQVLKMIDELDKIYGEAASKQKKRK